MTKAERMHLSSVAGLGCILCARLGTPGTPAEVHHLHEGQGIAQRGKRVIPLCPHHHRGQFGYHGMGKRAFEAVYGVTEVDLLKMTDGLIR